MIAIKTDLPLVQFTCGRIVDFEPDWLKVELTRAAERAGYSKWWLAEHVSESVSVYLKYQFEEPVVEVARLSKAVRSVLRVIGYAEVADHFHAAPPPNEIWLPEISRMAGPGFELAFFDLLKRRIQTLLDSDANEWKFTGLHVCVKMLQSAKAWGRSCAKMGDEVVTFIRDQAMQAEAKETPIAITIL